MKIPAALFALCLLISSCSRSVDCKDPSVDALEFSSASPADSITDDMVGLSSYVRGSEFISMVNDYNMVLIRKGKNVRVEFTHMVRPHEKDWKVVLRPSGKTYFVRDISFTQDKVRQSATNKKEVVCINKVFYTVNDAKKVYDASSQTSFNIVASLPVTY